MPENHAKAPFTIEPNVFDSKSASRGPRALSGRERIAPATLSEKPNAFFGGRGRLLAPGRISSLSWALGGPLKLLPCSLSDAASAESKDCTGGTGNTGAIARSARNSSFQTFRVQEPQGFEATALRRFCCGLALVVAQAAEQNGGEGAENFCTSSFFIIPQHAQLPGGAPGL